MMLHKLVFNIKKIFAKVPGLRTKLGTYAAALFLLKDTFKESVDDPDMFEKEFVKRKDGSIVTDGNCKIRDLNKYANWFLPEANSKTINGLLTEYIDQIPQANVCVEIKNYRFEILEIEDIRTEI